ncbi:hypothetical protein AB1Y20_011307 [Prymnesium parvum]|uniref:Uncharacterized protein n=1 Tax=Prymnesium parvum TaxID=97485 RepID=A0AB34ILH8_PRYPA
MKPLLAPSDPLLPLLLSSSAAFSLRDSAVGRALSAPMLSFTFSSALSNANLLPLAHPSYDLCSRVLPFSVCLGLLAASSPLSSPSPTTGALRPMLAAFAVGAAGTALGSLAAFALCVRTSLLPAASAAAAASLYCATYIGGSVNFFGVAAATGAARLDGLLPSLLAADLGLMALYLLALTAASHSPRLRAAFPADGARPRAAPSAPPPLPLSAPRAAAAGGIVALSVGAAAAGRWLCERFPAAAAALRLLGAPSLFLCCLFLGGMGASAKLSEMAAAGPAAATFGAIVLMVHCVVMLVGVRVFNHFGAEISLQTMLVASNANIGGPGTAVAMASAMGWTQLLPAAATCGTVGYSTATLLGVAMHDFLLRVVRVMRL